MRICKVKLVYSFKWWSWFMKLWNRCYLLRNINHHTVTPLYNAMVGVHDIKARYK